jgi:imidazolonepropionase-like amidohydrolase
VGTEKSVPDKYKSIDMAYVPVLMPGLWDCHIHYFGFGDKYSLDAAARVPLILAGARGARDVLVTLRAGFTSVRELAGYGIDLSKAIAEGIWLVPTYILPVVRSARQEVGGTHMAHVSMIYWMLSIAAQTSASTTELTSV